ncbi:MAG: DEAD/DEAH box helicase family protein [Candidatus Woesearchaeota archaeon]
MTLKDLNLKLSYRSENKTEMLKDFYLPVLSNAKIYKRAVGYFSSSVLLNLTNGISELIKKQGKMEIVASPKLIKQDIEAIKKGYELRDNIIEKALMRNFKEPQNQEDLERFNYLAHLICNGLLDIKIALVDGGQISGIYHEKIGIVEDEKDNVIAFTGSLNETKGGVESNFESIDVYCSWEGGKDLKRIEDKQKAFDRLWNNKTNRLSIYTFPNAIKEKILEYKKDSIVSEVEFNNYGSYEENSLLIRETNFKEKYPKLPEWLELREYQKKAVELWEKNNFNGLLNMATGTGKTLTALSAIVELWNKLNDKLTVIIVCPYKHLVDQWREDIVEFNMDPIIAYSDNRGWHKTLKKKINRYNLGITKNLSIITTNGSYKTERFQQAIKEIDRNILFIVDEVNNAGSKNFLDKLNECFEYRLALSATPKRKYDEEGTKILKNYFDKEVYYFGLKEAIENEFLVEYYYYPQIVYLTDSEYDEYIKISKKISKSVYNKDDEVMLTQAAKMLLIKRARLVAGADNKLSKLRELMKDKTDSNYNLVYSGATYVENETSNSEIRQIEAITRLLGNELDMRVAKFTAEETMEERRRIIKDFSDGETLQVIAAIKCLDEGVNIPAVKNAYILASSSNPREFIQRRGRILRTYKNKNFAYIYDFITLPRNIEEVSLLDEEMLKYDSSLIRKEIKRAKDFAELAVNKNKALVNLEKVENEYKKYNKGV